MIERLNVKKTLKKICLVGGLASLTSCNSIMPFFENADDIRHEKAVVPVEFLLDEGVGRVNVNLDYSLTNATHRNLIKDYGYHYSQDLFSFVVSDMVSETFTYQDLYAIGDYQNIHEQNFKRHLKKHYTLFDVNICDVKLTHLHRSPKEPEQICSHSAVHHLEVLHTK